MDFLEQMHVAGRPTIDAKPWMATKHMERVTVETLDRVIDECIASGLYALDLETTGLDSRVFDGCTNDKIVGCCLSPDGVRGYYIPIRHVNYDGEHHEVNVPWTVFARALHRLTDSPAVAIFHNAKFDQEFLEFNGGVKFGDWDTVSRWEDTIVLAYLSDPTLKRIGLKSCSKNMLGMEMIELEELFPADHPKNKLNFSFVDPLWDAAVWYGCSDAICTYLLYKHLHPLVITPNDGVPGQKTVYQIEKMCLTATRWMERARILIDREKVWEFIKPGQQAYFEGLKEVYTSASEILGRDVRPGYFKVLEKSFRWDDRDNFVDTQLEEAHREADKRKLDPTEPDPKGKKDRIKTIPKLVPRMVGEGEETLAFPVVYDVLSPQQLGLMFREMGVKGLSITEKSEQVKTTKAEMERLIDESGDDFPFMPKIRRFREAQKALGTYLYPLYRDCLHSGQYADNSIRIEYDNFGTDTGRFSVPAGNPDAGGTSYPMQGTPSPDKPASPYLKRIREVIIARPGRTLAAIDYAGVELRIVTNLSGEPKWVDEFFRCADCGLTFDRKTVPPQVCPKCNSDKIGDLHALTAMSIYGVESRQSPDWKDKRKHAKGLNFALCYGGGFQAAMRAVECDKNEGYRIKKQFDATYNGLFAWWKSIREFGRQHLFVMTAYGRRYPVKDINLPVDMGPDGKDKNGGFRSKADRNAVNSPVQGTSADITKLSMGLIHAECKKRGWLDKVHMLITVHDELVFEIDNDILEEAIEVLVDCMARRSTKNLSWAVPILVDVELGPSWAVPWNLNEIVRTGEWPAELAPLFPKMSAAKPVVAVVAEPEVLSETPETSDETTGGHEVETVVETPVVSPAPAQAPRPAEPVLPVGVNGKFTFRVDGERLSLGMVEKLAQLIQKCRGNGSSHLYIETHTGEVLWDEKGVDVNAAEFHIFAKDAGIIGLGT